MSLFNTAKNNSNISDTQKQPSILASLKSIITPKASNQSLSAPKTPTLSGAKIPSKMSSISKSLQKPSSKLSTSLMEGIDDNVATPMASALSASTSAVTSGSKSWRFWLGIIFILALLGFNIFTYAGDIVDFIKKLLAPILSALGYSVGETSKMTINTAAKGSTEIIDATADIATSGINVLESALTNTPNSGNMNNSDSALQNIEKNITSKQKASPIPDEADSRTQINRSIGKSGYCYIGEQNNIRSCVKVSENDTCMSGDIFPSRDLCINPNLRK